MNLNMPIKLFLDQFISYQNCLKPICYLLLLNQLNEQANPCKTINHLKISKNVFANKNLIGFSVHQ